MNVGFTMLQLPHQPSLNDWDPRGWPCWSLAPAGHGIQPRRSGPLAATHPHSGTGTSELKFTRKDVGFTIRMLLLCWLFCGCCWCCRCFLLLLSFYSINKKHLTIKLPDSRVGLIQPDGGLVLPMTCREHGTNSHFELPLCGIEVARGELQKPDS